MGLDIRLPIGMMFTLLGAGLALYGLITASDAAMYERSLGYNVNLWWGGFLFIFGITMWTFSSLASRKTTSRTGNQEKH